MERTKNIFGMQRNITYDADTGLIATEGTLSGTALNLAILVARGFVRGSRRKAYVWIEPEAYIPPNLWNEMHTGSKSESGGYLISEEEQWTSSSPLCVTMPRPPAAK